MQGGGRLLQAVGHVLRAGDGGQLCRQVTGGGLHLLHVVTIDVQGDAAAGEVGHIGVHGAGGGDGAVHTGAGGLHLLAGLRAGGPLRQGDVGGDVVFPAAGGHHTGHVHAPGAGGGGHHRAHGFHVVHGGDALQGLVRQGHRLLPGAALGHGDGQVHGVHVDIGHKGEAPGQGGSGGAHQQQQGHPQHHQLVVDGPGHRLAIGGVDLIQQSRLLGLLLAEHTGGHGGYQGQGHNEAGQQGIGHGQGQVREQLLGDALHEYDGQEHAHGGQGGGHDGAQHLPGPGYRRLDDGGPLGAQSIDILDDHHGVIHQHAHRHGQARQGDHVDGNAGEVHQHHGEDHADGDGAQGDHRGPQVPQEQIQDQHREQRAPAQRRQNGVDDKVYVVPLVHQGYEGKPLVLRLQLPEAAVDVVGHLRRGVGGLLVEGDDDAVLAVELVVDLRGVVGDGHVGHVLHADGVDAVHSQVKEHQVLQVLPGVDGIAHGDHVVDAVLLQISGGHGEVLGRQQGGDGG